MGCKLGDGRTASFWFDNWSSLGIIWDFFGTSGPCRLGIPLHSTVADVCGNLGWILPSARSRNPSVIDLRNQLIATPPPCISRGPYCFTWGLPN